MVETMHTTFRGNCEPSGGTIPLVQQILLSLDLFGAGWTQAGLLVDVKDEIQEVGQNWLFKLLVLKACHLSHLSKRSPAFPRIVGKPSRRVKTDSLM